MRKTIIKSKLALITIAVVLTTQLLHAKEEPFFPGLSLTYNNPITNSDETIDIPGKLFNNSVKRLVQKYRNQKGLNLDELKKISKKLSLLKFYPMNSSVSLQTGDLSYYSEQKNLPSIYILAELLAKKTVLYAAELEGRHIAKTSGDLSHLCKPLTDDLYKRFRSWIK